MGREIYTIIKNRENKIVWSSVELIDVDCPHDNDFICGRSDETGAIANRCSLIENGFGDGEQGEMLDFTDKKVYDDLLSELRSLEHAAELSRQEIEQEIEDARAASRNVTTLEEFVNFRDYIHERTDDLSDYYSPAQDIISLMERTRQRAKELVTAEQGFFSQDDFAGYTMLWVNDE